MSSARDVFKQHLTKERQAQANSPSPKSVRDFVRICLPDIRRAVKKKTSWDIIAKAIHAVAEETYGVEIRIAPSTAKRAYYDITGKKNRRSRSNSSTPRKSSTPANITTSAQAIPPTVPVETPVPVPAPEPVARSPALEPELETTPVVDKPATDETQQAALTEELHPNRFRDRFKTINNPKTTTGYENCKSL